MYRLCFPILFLSFAASAATLTPVKLALNWKAEPQFGGFYDMTLHKSDEKNGLKVEVLEGGSGTPTVQMLANGQMDFVVASAEEILISNSRNPKNPLVAVFAVFQTNPQMIMCHKEKKFKNLGEVFNSTSTVAVQSGLTYFQYLKKKYPNAKAKFVPYLGGIGPYLNDSNFCQQGFATSEPLIADKDKEPATAFLIADEGFNPYTTVLAVQKYTLEKHPELVQKMLKAVAEGWISYVHDPKPANAFMATINKAMDIETFEKSALAQEPLIQSGKGHRLELGKMTADRWATLEKQLVDLKIIQAPGPKTEDLFKNY